MHFRKTRARGGGEGKGSQRWTSKGSDEEGGAEAKVFLTIHTGCYRVYEKHIIYCFFFFLAGSSNGSLKFCRKLGIIYHERLGKLGLGISRTC